MPVVLGFNCYKHDAAAAILVDGRLMAAAEEERFTRRKHDSDYPAKAVEYCLKTAGVTASDIDCAAYYMVPGEVARENIRYSRHYLFSPGGGNFLLGQLAGSRKMSLVGATLRDHLGPSFRARMAFVDHHEAHAWAAWYCSGFESAAVLTMDGVGERTTSILGRFDGPRLSRIAGSAFPNSPGVYYSAVTKHLGFEPDSDEYKVMGLASYGEPEFEDLFKRMIRATDDGRIVVDTGLMDIHRGVHFARFAPSVERLIGPVRRPGEEITHTHENVAASAQKALEAVGLKLATILRSRTGLDRLVISGGVGLNCVMNGVIEREAGFAEVYPLPAPHDAGTSIGAAVAAYIPLFGADSLESPDGMYLGSSYSEKEIEAALVQSKQPWTKPEDIHMETARLVADGKVVGLFQGRMEFGPRALGNRSILADPRRADMKDIVNSVVKQREGFRPFAPSCLEDRAGEYFEGCGKSRYMISTYMVAPGKAEVIPAVTHVDGTARVQTVTPETNESYWTIIHRFSELTGVPVVLNTSFNVKGEPIVESPVDALRCFWGTGLDALSIPPFLIVKPDRF